MSLRYFLQLSYFGKNYSGWQIQPNAITIQEILEKALSTILGSEIKVTGCGRTDTGVHAMEFFAHFNSNIEFEEIQIKKLIYKLNGFIPYDISINNIFFVHNDIHARFSALTRTYEYHIITKKNPFKNDYAYFFHKTLNIELMNKAGVILSEYEDFTSFSKTGTDTKTNICKILYTNIEYKNNLIIFTITADRFLRNMVRAITGTIIDIGLEKTSLNELHLIIKSKNRSKAGKSVPAHGLYLTKVTYPATVIPKT